MANASPSVIVHPGRHVSWYGDDTQRARAMAILNGLLGSWGRRGGFYFKESIKVPKFPSPTYPHPKWDWRNICEKYPIAQMGITSEVIKCAIPSEDNKYPVKAMMVAGTNITKSIPQKELLEIVRDKLSYPEHREVWAS